MLLAALCLLLFGQMTDGRITNRTTSEDSDSTSYRVNYVYTVGGQEYHARDSVSLSSYDKVNVGQATPVKYLPFSPGARPKPSVPLSTAGVSLFMNPT